MIGEVFKIGCIWRFSQNPAVAVNNFLYRQATNDLVTSEIEDLVAAFKEEVIPAYKAAVTAQLTLVELRIGRAPGFPTEHVEPIGEAGTQTGEAMPAILAGFLRFFTADFSKRGKGGVFLPTATEGANVGGIPAAGQVAAWQAVGDAALAGMKTSGVTHEVWDLVIYSKADNAFKAVTSTIARPTWSHQIDRRDLF